VPSIPNNHTPCPKCGMPIITLELKAGGHVAVDPFPASGVYVLNGEMKGMRATVAYFPHEKVCALGAKSHASKKPSMPRPSTSSSRRPVDWTRRPLRASN
jgi:hypothetical protein